MKVVILTGDQGNQKALCNKIAGVCEVAAIVLSANVPRKKPPAARRARTFLNRVGNRLVGRPFVETWFRMLGEYEKRFPNFPDAPIVRVENVNDAATLAALEKYAPDLTIVSGTNLVGKKVIAAASEKGVVNLHTGISPYVKGGPNCTNWCLAKGWFHLIGSTVMWLDAGIDTGSIIATEQTPQLDGAEDLFGLHWKVMEHAHDLYVRAIGRFGGGERLPSVPQASIAEGKTFYNVDWNVFEMRRALKNFREDYPAYCADAERKKRLTNELRLVSLNE
jgi:folate-dependent phosphoribosylglycinamide formyltransferase PurN